jgi:hypothetical protein
MSEKTNQLKSSGVSGFVKPGFEAVRQAFVENFSRRHELGAACCIYDQERIYARSLENPSGNGVGTARAIARAYSVFATGGRELGLRQETLQALMAPAVPPLHGFYDEVMKKEMCFSLGFLKPSRMYPFGRPPRCVWRAGAWGILRFC